VSVDLSSKVKLKLAFPAAEIRACLQEELINIVESRAGLLGQPLPSTPAAIVTAQFRIDSLDVVEILCKIDELVGFDVPQSVVRAGGYDAIDKALHHLMPRIEKVWSKQKGGTA
jgi:acyl carrier protein